MSRVAAEAEEWVPGLAPSADLGHSHGSGAVSFAEFRRCYLRKLRRPRHALTLARLRKTAGTGVLILVTAASDAEHSPAFVLAEVLRDPLRRAATSERLENAH